MKLSLKNLLSLLSLAAHVDASEVISPSPPTSSDISTPFVEGELLSMEKVRLPIHSLQMFMDAVLLRHFPRMVSIIFISQTVHYYSYA